MLVVEPLRQLGDLLGDRAGIAGALLLHLVHLLTEQIEAFADRIDQGFHTALGLLMLGLEVLLRLFEQLFRRSVQRFVRQRLEPVLHLLAQRRQALALGFHRRFALFQTFLQRLQFRRRSLFRLPRLFKLLFQPFNAGRPCPRLGQRLLGRVAHGAFAGELRFQLIDTARLGLRFAQLKLGLRQSPLAVAQLGAQAIRLTPGLAQDQRAHASQNETGAAQGDQGD